MDFSFFRLLQTTPAEELGRKESLYNQVILISRAVDSCT
jgi:hypothetical protein